MESTPPSAPLQLQIVLDSEQPHVLADWWAETLGWRVEPQDENFIRSMIEQGFATEGEDTTMHNAKLVWKGATAIGPETASGAGQPRILFQHVPEAKAVKNRMHFDIRHDRDSDFDLGAFRDWLVERGASEVGEGAQGPHRWAVFVDPEGNEFCVDM